MPDRPTDRRGSPPHEGKSFSKSHSSKRIAVNWNVQIHTNCIKIIYHFGQTISSGNLPASVRIRSCLLKRPPLGVRVHKFWFHFQVFFEVSNTLNFWVWTSEVTRCGSAKRVNWHTASYKFSSCSKAFPIWKPQAVRPLQLVATFFWLLSVTSSRILEALCWAEEWLETFPWLFTDLERCFCCCLPWSSLHWVHSMKFRIHSPTNGKHSLEPVRSPRTYYPQLVILPLSSVIHFVILPRLGVSIATIFRVEFFP